ncbi:hypothetical protein MOK15_07060 [Sphingobium sp. BYY-5]|uniref:hypothetical protein n=1 Tax=Sphingobium sp. BYY-5 TaxID=2926400 RepID=UPI001FA76383|nr:hypothetical protein [Sphingobium sp. BYY-5]MCI4589848.1 hypothetical protein [Sphingobium sp. BYY-5]
MRAALERLAEARAARRRARIAASLADEDVAAVIEGEDVRASARGLAGRWSRELALREAGRGTEIMR